MPMHPAHEVPPVSAYIRSLQAEAERSNAASAAAVATGREAGSRGARARLSLLEDRLALLLRDIPAEVQREGLSLPTLTPRLQGRWRVEANPGQLGTAFRKLGWRRERRWRGGDVGFSALWFPPAAT